MKRRKPKIQRTTPSLVPKACRILESIFERSRTTVARWHSRAKALMYGIVWSSLRLMVSADVLRAAKERPRQRKRVVSLKMGMIL